MNWKLFIILALVLSSCATSKTDKTIEGIYDVSCGKCNFDMTGDMCDLAIEINGKHYYIEGSEIDDHGDEHAADGLCSTTRKAHVKGQIKFGVFMAESVELIKD